ncbi:MAG: RNA 2',3'-cyclic phosphodiesterase [Caldicoprobacterales bacterium]|jgi:2'-5' RNA ligase|nr:RNA 2',3'-cyclic phosphodiesterase [Clostridiales bacterium]
MRLFIAINFDEKSKNAIQQISDEVKKHCKQGRFVKSQHLHLTLEFLGNVPSTQVEKVKSAMDQVKEEKFTIKLSEIGFFRGRDGHIYWIGIEENKTLLDLQKRLHKALENQGFILENRLYKPHITIGRRVKVKDTFLPEKLSSEIKQVEVDVDKIDLMKSEHVNGELVYSIEYTRRF